jgi:serine/threonine-protein kinase
MLTGEQLGSFAIERELGSGAMGTVYLGRNTKTGQRVAIKVMAPELNRNRHATARFERESQILKQLNHANIVKILSIGKSQGMHYYAMEYLEGESLDRVMDRRGRISWEEVVRLGQQLCLALQHVHLQGIVHRDLKPSNFMLTRDGTVKLTDFGIAKDLDVTQLTSANCTVGTASYMSPEQCKGEKNITHKSDLYSLGVVLYELLTGRKPFEAESAMVMFEAHVKGTFVPPGQLVLDIPKWLNTLVCHLLEKEPEHRPMDADTVHQALERVVERVSVQKSAGDEEARSRVMDRTPGSPKPKLDEADKEAVRALLGGKKRRRKKTHFYQKTWFTVLACLAVVAGLAGLIYIVAKPASADDVFKQLQALMEPDNPANYEKAHEPINEFYRRHRSDPRVAQVDEWNQRIIAFETETKLRTAMKLARTIMRGFKPENPYEAAAYLATRYEDFGDVVEANGRWQELSRITPATDNWHYLAEAKLNKLRPKLPPQGDIPRFKKDLLKAKLAEATRVETDEKARRTICEDIVDLYDKEVLLQDEVEQARKLLKAEAKPEKPAEKADDKGKASEKTKT